MSFLVSAKGSDVTVWRAAGDFTVSFRQALLNRLEFCGSDESEQLLIRSIEALEEMAAANDAFYQQCEELIAEVRCCYDVDRFRELTATFYAGLYDQFGRFNSAAAFYQDSSRFLQALSEAVMGYAAKQTGLLSRHIPHCALIALGPAGRHEFSPFCPLQIVLVHQQAEHPDLDALSQFGRLIHEGFEASGLQVDPVFTPRNPHWRGMVSEWRQQVMAIIDHGEPQQMIDLLRFADQSALYDAAELQGEFRSATRALLEKSSPMLTLYVTRAMALSNGVGMMGGLRLEKSDPHRGMFGLVDHGLQPLSASVSALGLLKGLESASTPQRIREILQRGELNVDMSERMLQAWHVLNELRLERERSLQPTWSNQAALYLEFDRLEADKREAMRSSLDTVVSIQRHIGVIFNGMEG